MAKFTGHSITSDSALGAAKIQRSLRFDGNDSNTQHLVRTPSSTGNQKIWTFSVWIKRGTVTGSGPDYIYSAHDGSDYFALYFRYNELYSYFSPGNNYGQVNSRKFRDSTSWMHIVHQVDATNTVQRIWINGEELSLSSSRNPGNSNYPMNESGVDMYVGKASWRDDTVDGYMAEVNHIDGSLVAPTEFGFTDPVTNIWMPKRYEGTYGTNGFYLDFSDNSSTAALGIDKSPNGNDFTVNNFSVAAWPDGDSVIDTPTNNFCTLNDADRNDNVYLANGSLQTAASSTGGHYPVFTTMPVKSGKWYLEWKFLTNDSGLPSIMEALHDQNSYNTDSTVGNNTSTVNKRGYGLLPGDGRTSSSSGYASYGSAISSSDTAQCAFDADTGKIYWGKNNTWFNSGNPETGANPAFSGIDMTKEYLFTWHVYGNNNNVSVNFGSQGFTYTPPAGFKALCQQNLPLTQTPSVVTKPQKHFDCLTWDGDSTHNRKITGLEFKPDMVWIKSYTHSSYGAGGLYYHHMIWDVLRGVGSDTIGSSSRKELTVNENYQEGRGANYTDYYGHVSSFDEGGFEVDKYGGEPAIYVNLNSKSYVAWCWKAGGAGVANSDGTISSTVSVNQQAGFSMVLYTGNATSGATVGHGLNKIPKWFIIKERSNANNWVVYHESLGDSSGNTNVQFLDLDNDIGGGFAGGYNNTAPTSSVFSLGNSDETNKSSGTFIAYCWAEIPGYSKFGKYTGNGSSTGQFVHLGFRPAFVLLKRYNSAASWVLHDYKRSGSNPDNDYLHPDNTQSQSDGSGGTIDLLADGFKLRMTAGTHNGSGDSYIYMAFAEQPGVTSFNTRPNAR